MISRPASAPARCPAQPKPVAPVRAQNAYSAPAVLWHGSPPESAAGVPLGGLRHTRRAPQSPGLRRPPPGAAGAAVADRSEASALGAQHGPGSLHTPPAPDPGAGSPPAVEKRTAYIAAGPWHPPADAASPPKLAGARSRSAADWAAGVPPADVRDASTAADQHGSASQHAQHATEHTTTQGTPIPAAPRLLRMHSVSVRCRASLEHACAESVVRGSSCFSISV